jgi:outer membrane protein assembly factor BamB
MMWARIPRKNLGKRPLRGWFSLGCAAHGNKLLFFDGVAAASVFSGRGLGMTANKLAVCVAFAALSCGMISAADEPAAYWPGWRGKDRDAVSKDKGLLQEWPKGGPKLLWTFEAAGFGYGTPAIVGKEMFILGKDDDGEFIKKLSTDGKELARAKLDHGDNKYNTGWGGGPRSTPSVDGDLVIALSSNGRLVCFDRGTLSEKWAKSLVDDFGSKPPMWGYAESPLVDGDKVVVTPGGKNCVVALNKNSGETVWKSTGISDAPQYSSLVILTVDGTKMYVNQGAKILFGVDAESGKFAWKFGEIVRKTAVIPTPIVSGNRVYATTDYEAGCECVDIVKAGDSFEAKKVFVNKEMQNHHGGVILVDGHIYGNSGNRNTSWVCQKLSDGTVAWTHKSRDAGKGSIGYADGRFYCFEQEPGGSCILIESSPAGWKEHGRFKLPKNSELSRGQGLVWAHPIVVDGKLYLRDLDLLFCYDVKKQ